MSKRKNESNGNADGRALAKDPVHEYGPSDKINVKKHFGKLRVCVAGGGGFIGSHIAYRLKKEGHYVVAADWAANTYFKQEDYCDEFHLLDLRQLDHCLKVTKDCDWVFNMAADMGGMGFITVNNATIMFNNTMISLNLCEAARKNKVKRFFYASSACVYNEKLQEQTDDVSLREDMAWPAQPQDAYGLEKLYAEKCAQYFGEDFPDCAFRVGRFHNIYGPEGTWKGGREKVPAAFCRKGICSADTFEVWGDGKQTRSFCYVDDCVEAVLRLTASNHKEPINIGSEEMISMNDLAKLVIKIGNRSDLTIKNVKGPQGVRGRNSNNDIVRKVLQWEPQISLEKGMTLTYKWIQSQVEADKKTGIDVTQYGVSKVYELKTPDDEQDKKS